MNERNDIRPDNSSSSPSEKSGPLGEHLPIEADVLALSAQEEESNANREPDLAVRKQAKVRVEYKHSLATRWMHWINFPLLFVMIYSGMLIYWADSQHEGLNAHHVYRVGIGDWTLFRFFPRWFYNSFHLKYQLAQGLAYHFFFMWFFALNGIAYVLYTFLSGEWRNLIPTRHSFAGAFHVVLHDLGLGTRPLPQQKFNDAQRIAYTGVVLMGMGSPEIKIAAQRAQTIYRDWLGRNKAKAQEQFSLFDLES